ncbi:sensor histidine kinase [Fodinibius saliphilus]|uniref:sensor histidine kinase n=1 Tax=Fodinibius saliphilus TaxID=1920650 RepID=UPI0011080D0E|nr:ATP-binding protein [Fodinibius saliphilus]
MNDHETDRPHQPSPLTLDPNKQYLDLQTYTELGQQIMDAPVCEINIIDTYYQDTVAHNVDEAVYKDLICYDTIRQNGRIYEIEDLAKNKHYKDQSYVKSSPYFQYHCSAKLTNKTGRTIGSMYVLDTKSKSVSKDQKEQFQQLALLVMNTIELESQFRDLKTKFTTLHESIHKINHDVRTPISGIVGVSDLLLEKKDHTEFPTQQITMIKEAAETIINIIDGVLEDLNTDNYEYQEQKKTPFINSVEQLKRLFRPPSKAKEVSLTFVNKVDASLDLPRPLSLKLLQITSNLLSNAVKFTPPNGAIKVTMTHETDKNMLCISVSDNGQGMTADQLMDFNKGTPVARAADNDRKESVGQGLRFIKEVVAQTGGTISVKTGQNNGTQFLVTLPIPVDNFEKLLSSLQENQNQREG